MKKMGNFLILLGVILIIFFAYTKVQTAMEQKRLIEEYTTLSFTEEVSAENTEQLELKNGESIGLLEIPKIELKTPIVEGAGPENIKFAVGHLPSSGSVYELGKGNQNFAIAGHRSYTYGKFFNRLDELAEGDEVIVYARNTILTYKIFSKKIVEPTNVEVVEPIEDKSIVTLITCHPEYSDAQRLIVFAELVSKKILNEKEFLAKIQ